MLTLVTPDWLSDILSDRKLAHEAQVGDVWHGGAFPYYIHDLAGILVYLA